jgi:hypothetical protein
MTKNKANLTMDDFERRNPTHPVLAVPISLAAIFNDATDKDTLFYGTRAAGFYFQSELRMRDGEPYWLPNATEWPLDKGEQASLLGCPSEWWEQHQFQWGIFKSQVDAYVIKMKGRSATEEKKQRERWAKKIGVAVTDADSSTTTQIDFDEEGI